MSLPFFWTEGTAYHIGQRLDFDHEASACLQRRWGQLCRPSPTGTARATGLGHAGIAARLRPPQAWAASAASWPLARIGGESRGGIGAAGAPLDVPLPPVVCQGGGVFPWGSDRGLRWRLRPLTRLHDDNAQALLGDAPIAVCDLPRAAHAGAMPALGGLVLGPPRLLQQEGQGGWLPPPGCEGLAAGPGPWDARAAIDLRLQTPPSGRRLEAVRSATIPRPPSTPKARPSAIATGVSTRARRLPSRPPRRRGPPPSPRTPRRRSPCLRSSRPSLLGPEAGRGAPGLCGASS